MGVFVRGILTFLFLLLLSLATVPCFAVQSGRYSSELRVSADIIDRGLLTITVDANMRMPTVYDDFKERIQTKEATKVFNGINGSNAEITVAGPANTNYSLSLDKRCVLVDDKGHTLYIELTVSDGTHRKLGPKLVGDNGEDKVIIIGSAIFDGKQQIGSYSNAANPLVITAIID